MDPQGYESSYEPGDGGGISDGMPLLTRSGDYPSMWGTSSPLGYSDTSAPGAESDHLRVLLVEDNPSFADLMEAILNEGDYGNFYAVRAARLSDARDLMKESEFDVVLLDLSLPDSTGINTLTLLHQENPNLPVVVLTGTQDENLALDALRNGAQDYLVKGQNDNEVLVRAIRYAVERKRVERKFLESESRYRALMEQASDGIFVVDRRGRLTDVNPVGATMLGYEPNELLHMNQRDLVMPLARELNHEGLEEFRSGRIIVQERVVRHKNGTNITVEIGAKLLDDGRIMAIARDVTARKVAEEALQARAQEQANLLHQLLNAQEAERRRLSMDIHDGPLQSLGVSLLALDRSIRRLDRGELDASRRELNALRASLTGTVTEVRAVLADLSLELLTQYGLETALRNHVERFSEVTGIEVDLRYQVKRKLGADVTLLMYRLAQEALANIRKHSRANSATIQMNVSRGDLSMLVSDNGRGFDPKAVLQKRYAGEKLGLRSMRERVELAGGKFTIESSPESGTILTFSCPLSTPSPVTRRRRKS
ncbi:MAG: PAS domain S-box protein [Chloroflexota bacterium]